MFNLKSLTTAEVADLCRVSDATVKRWAAAGLLKSERTGGGHRRFAAEEVARFVREQNLNVRQDLNAAAKKTVTNNHGEAANQNVGMFEHLINGREAAAADLLIRALLGGEPLPQIFDSCVVAAMRRVGEDWFGGAITVAQEHLATRAISNAVQKLRAVIPAQIQNQRLAMCFAIENDFHELPVLLAQIVLESRGWTVLNFGANMPFYLFGDEIKRRMPELVCIAATVIADLERAARDYHDFRRELERLNVKIIIGGRAFADEIVRRRFPADFYAANFSEFAEYAKSRD